MTGLYIHFPFCQSKCNYCDFYSIPLAKYSHLMKDYETALPKELVWESKKDWGKITSIYLGGGTPSLMTPSALSRLLDTTYAHFFISPDCEITMEANPGTVTLSQLKSYRNAGVNRLSIGVQSLKNHELITLGRIHSRDDVIKAVDNLRDAGFSNIGIDLIYGIPGQNTEEWLQTLEEAIALEPEHLSCYLLQLDDHVPLAKQVVQGELALLDEDTESEMYYSALKTLKDRGYQHYELSNWSLDGFHCRHNLNYWTGGAYLGIGAGAVSYKDGIRYVNQPNVEEYAVRIASGEKPVQEEMERMNPRDRAAEAMILGLRLIKGINIPEYGKLYEIDPFTVFDTAIEWGVREGLLKNEPPYLSLTPKAYFLSNLVFEKFI
ncbi:MAG: radical SAM family heme chaperone HemW [Chitinophagales bacterium]